MKKKNCEATAGVGRNDGGRLTGVGRDGSG